MRSHPRDTVVRAWARLIKAQQIALASIETALKTAKLPPLAWYDALLELEGAGERGLRPSELQREMLLAQYNLSRLIDRIERAGYVERPPATTTAADRLSSLRRPAGISVGACGRSTGPPSSARSATTSRPSKPKRSTRCSAN